MKVVKYFPYRQAIGSSKTFLEGNMGYILALALANKSGEHLDNHTAWVIGMPGPDGEQIAYVWSDNKLLIDCPRLLAGDCNREFPTLTVLWEKPVA